MFLASVGLVLAMDYYPGEDCPQHMAVGPDGNLHLLNFPLCGLIEGFNGPVWQVLRINISKSLALAGLG